MATSGANGTKFFWWGMGVLAVLLAAGVIGSIATYASVKSLDTNVSLLRDQFQRGMDRHESRIESVDAKINAHMQAAVRGPGEGT